MGLVSSLPGGLSESKTQAVSLKLVGKGGFMWHVDLAPGGREEVRGAGAIDR